MSEIYDFLLTLSRVMISRNPFTTPFCIFYIIFYLSFSFETVNVYEASDMTTEVSYASEFIASFFKIIFLSVCAAWCAGIIWMAVTVKRWSEERQ